MKPGFLREHWRIVAAAMRLLDLSVIGLAGVAAWALRFGQTPFAVDAPHAAAILGGILLGGLCLNAAGIYDSWRGAHLLRIVQRAAIAWLIAFGLLLITLVALQEAAPFSRIWLAAWFGAALGGLTLVRIAGYGLMRAFRRRGWNTRRIVIYGAGGVGRQAASNIRRAGWTGFQFQAFFDDAPDLAGRTIQGIPVVGGLTELQRHLEQAGIDEVWLALPLVAEARLQEIADALRQTSVKVRLIPGFFGLRLIHDPLSDIAGMTMINLAQPPLAGVNRLLKEAEDRLIAALLLLALSPLFAAVAIAIRASMGGPVIYSQMRCGWDGRPIRVHKFRTMTRSHDPAHAPWQTRRDDPRVTRLGGLLRRTSIDELPQLWNVLRGDMSIVGPRPHALVHHAYYRRRIDNYMRRHRVKPGITGWAQINGYRGETRTVEEMEARVEHDLFYIDNWSLGLDLRIILLTPWRMLHDPRAY